MDPWCNSESSCSDSSSSSTDFFEDNFKPTVSDTLPDSKEYLETLERKLYKLKNDPDILKQLAEKREACMQQLLYGSSDFDQDNDEELDLPVNSSAFFRTIAPERQAITSGEIVELVKYDHLIAEDETNDNSDTASR